MFFFTFFTPFLMWGWYFGIHTQKCLFRKWGSLEVTPSLLLRNPSWHCSRNYVVTGMETGSLMSFVLPSKTLQTLLSFYSFLATRSTYICLSLSETFFIAFHILLYPKCHNTNSIYYTIVVYSSMYIIYIYMYISVYISSLHSFFLRCLHKEATSLLTFLIGYQGSFHISGILKYYWSEHMCIVILMNVWLIFFGQIPRNAFLNFIISKQLVW